MSIVVKLLFLLNYIILRILLHASIWACRLCSNVILRNYPDYGVLHAWVALGKGEVGDRLRPHLKIKPHPKIF